MTEKFRIDKMYFENLKDLNEKICKAWQLGEINELERANLKTLFHALNKAMDETGTEAIKRGGWY